MLSITNQLQHLSETFQTSCFAMSFDPSHLLSQLSAMDREKGDIKLQCQGDEVEAHSFVLGMRYSLTILLALSLGLILLINLVSKSCDIGFDFALPPNFLQVEIF